MAVDRPHGTPLPSDPLMLAADSSPKRGRASPDRSALESAIGHAFADPTLLTRALTHVSALPSGRGRGASYQRLEFLGDRVLGLCVAAMLIEAFPDSDEGELSRRLAALVRKETCAEVAAAWGVPAHVKVSAADAFTGARQRTTVLGDVCESIIGAVFMDAGFEAAMTVVRAGFGARMAVTGATRRDAKTSLQEWAQGQGRPAPTYEIVDRSGPDHAPEFIVRVSVAGLAPSEARGRSRRDAEQAVARAVLVAQGVWSEDMP